MSIFYVGKFFEDSKGEMWIQILSCSLWAHLDCTGVEEKVDYVCDICYFHEKSKLQPPTRDDSSNDESFHSDMSSLMDDKPPGKEPLNKDTKSIFCVHILTIEG